MTLNFKPLTTSQEMQAWDAASIALGIPEFTLMENAAREAFYVLEKLKGPLAGKYILLFMGSGNNGGDAAALARHLNDAGAYPLILHTKKLKDYSKTTAEHANLAKALNISFVKLPKGDEINLEELLPQEWHKPYIVVDGLLGTGFTPPLQPLFENAIALINKMSKYSFVFSLDIPSGCCSLSGNAHGIAVKAHATVCFAAAKPGLVLPQARAFVGHLYVRNIGIPRQISESHPASFRLIDAKSIMAIMPSTPKDSHKNTWGHVLVLGGSKGLSGAAHLAAFAALRSGVGLVTVGAPAKLCNEIKSDIPDIMTLAVSDDYQWPKTLPQNLEDKLSQVSAIAIGPGLGTSQDAIDFLQAILAHPARPRAIIDADALNILAKHETLLTLIQDEDILTPHPGEAARLLGLSSKEVQNNRMLCMQTLTALAPCVWILKGAASLLAKGTSPIYILPHDIPSLAIAGSGDVLSGCAAAFAARKPEICALHVAAIAMSIHANAGFMAQMAFPKRGNMASDLVNLLPQAMASIADFPKGYHDDL